MLLTWKKWEGGVDPNFPSAFNATIIQVYNAIQNKKKFKI